MMEVPRPAYDLWLPGIVTPTLNNSLREHWGARKKRAMALCWAIRVALGRQRPPVAPFRRAHLRIERRNSGAPPDYDGLVGGCKSLIDCLLPMKMKGRPYGLDFIHDDNPDCLVLEAIGVRVKRPEIGMRLVLTPLETP